MNKPNDIAPIIDLTIDFSFPYSTWTTHLSMKEGSLFCSVLQLQDPLNRDASDRVLGVFGKVWMRRGAWASFHKVWTCCANVLGY